jgi:hypothetical protein
MSINVFVMFLAMSAKKPLQLFGNIDFTNVAHFMENLLCALLDIETF